MEEGRQKSKRLSYTAKFKREVIWCAQEKGNHRAAAIFGVDESNTLLWRKHETAISGCEASRRKFTGPKKGQFPETDDAVFTFSQERCKTGLFVSYDLLREEAIKKATSLNIPQSRFNASKLLYCIVLMARTAALSFLMPVNYCTVLFSRHVQRLYHF